MRAFQSILALPLPLRGAVLGFVGLGALGGATGLVIGLRVYAPTAWAAAFEIGIPSALLGVLLGLTIGFVASLPSRQHGSTHR